MPGGDPGVTANRLDSGRVPSRFAGARAVVAAATAEGRRSSLHAYPKVVHAAPNAVRRKAAFTLLGETDFECPEGTTIRCDDWAHRL